MNPTRIAFAAGSLFAASIALSFVHPWGNLRSRVQADAPLLDGSAVPDEVLQCAALFAIFLALELPANRLMLLTQTALIYAMLVATALSGVQYLWRAAHLLRTYD